jgi:predicted transposase YbfD/YdcC
MSNAASVALLDHFATLKDPRQHAKVLYPLPEIMLLVLSATLAGADDFVETVVWGKEHLAFLRRFYRYENDIPSHDTLCEKIEYETRYYLCSLALCAPTFARAVRAHWGVENRLHWVLDVIFREDLARFRTGHGPQNMAIIRRTTLNLLSRAKPTISLKTDANARVGTSITWKPSFARTHDVQAIRLGSALAFGDQLLDGSNGLGWVQAFRTGVSAIHDCMTAIQLEGIFQFIEPLTRRFIA